MRHNRDIFSILFNMKVYCVFTLDEFTQYIIFNKKEKKITLNYSKSAAVGFFPMDSRMSSK